MKNKYLNFFLLNLSASLMSLALISKIQTFFVIENILFLIISSGFILSFFIKESPLARYIKVIFLNSQFFGFSFAFFSFVFASDGPSNFSLAGLIMISQGIVAVYLFGALIGIISKTILERLRKQEKGEFVGQNLA